MSDATLVFAVQIVVMFGLGACLSFGLLAFHNWRKQHARDRAFREWLRQRREDFHKQQQDWYR